MNKHKDIVWSDRKRNFLGLPWTFTRYQLSPNRLFIETGFLNSREAEIRLYRVTDMTLTRNLWQKIIGTGTIHCDSADPTMRDFDIKNIKNPFDTEREPRLHAGEHDDRRKRGGPGYGSRGNVWPGR